MDETSIVKILSAKQKEEKERRIYSKNIENKKK